MKEHINFKDSKDSSREVQVNKILPNNVIRSRIPIRIPLKEKIEVTNASQLTSCISQTNSVTTLPEIRYGRDRTRLVSKHGKRFGKSTLESQISFKYRKYNWEKSMLIKQQLNYDKECDEMKVLLEKMKNVGDDVNKSNEFYKTNASGDCSSDLINQGLSSVHHKFMTANAEIFSLLKGLGAKAIQVCYYRTMKNLNKETNEDVNFFATIQTLKTKFFEVAKEGNNKFLEYENEVNQLKATNADLTEKLKMTEQRLVTQATENKAMHDSREESFTKIEEKLRDIIEKLQCQFRAQKLLQAKTERELAVLRSDFFILERKNDKLNVEFTDCSNELEICRKNNEMLKEKAAHHSKEKEEIVKKYKQQLVASHRTIDRMENELMETKNKSRECSAAQTKG